MSRHRALGDGSFVQAGELLDAAIVEMKALRERKDVAKAVPDAPRALSVAITHAETALLWVDKVAREGAERAGDKA